MILAFETSCDETAVAVVHEGRVLSSLVSSQARLHEEYGGVVPELAAREHLANLLPLAHEAIAEAFDATRAGDSEGAVGQPPLERGSVTRSNQVEEELIPVADDLAGRSRSLRLIEPRSGQ